MVVKLDCQRCGLQFCFAKLDCYIENLHGRMEFSETQDGYSGIIFDQLEVQYLILALK